MTNKGIELIKKYEGFESKAYKCSAGVWTIGYGATYYMNGTPVKEGDTITLEEAENLLNEMSEKNYGSYVDKYVTSNINPYQRDALISFAYNIGNANLKSSTLLKKVNNNPTDKTIKDEFLRWNKAGGKVLKGLTLRREAEAELYFSEYSDSVKKN